jgi:hypothetical protein
MDRTKFQHDNSVSLIYAFKVALDREDYLLCRDIKEELSLRKKAGELVNDVINATENAYRSNAEQYRDMQYEVFSEMLEEIKKL